MYLLLMDLNFYIICILGGNADEPLVNNRILYTYIWNISVFWSVFFTSGYDSMLTFTICIKLKFLQEIKKRIEFHWKKIDLVTRKNHLCHEQYHCKFDHKECLKRLYFQESSTVYIVSTTAYVKISSEFEKCAKCCGFKRQARKHAQENWGKWKVWFTRGKVF